METVLYLIRHAEAVPKVNFKDIVNSDATQIQNEKAVLSVSGELDAQELSKIAELQNIDAVYSSNYARAIGTAKYIACQNNTIINIDERLNERKIGDIKDMPWREFTHMQLRDGDYKLEGGESLNEVKNRIVEGIKSILMFENGNRVAVVGHSTAIRTLLSVWCDVGYNYDGNMILSYNDNTILDSSFTAPMVFKVTFDGMDVTNVECVNIDSVIPKEE